MIQSSFADGGLDDFGDLGRRPCPAGQVRRFGRCRRRRMTGKVVATAVRRATGKVALSPAARRLGMQAGHVLKTIVRMAKLRKVVRGAVIANYLKKYSAFRIAAGRKMSPKVLAHKTRQVHGLIKKLGARVA